MKLNSWTQGLRALYDKAIIAYQNGNRDPEAPFTPDDQQFLTSIGLKPINLHDFVEDWVSAKEPDWDTFLLIAAARRDYFLYAQDGRSNTAEIPSDTLPSGKTTLGGIAWLPRIMAKARCFLEGGLCHDIMYCCGGDRAFLKSHAIHPADFLREIWAAQDDDAKILAFVERHRWRKNPTARENA